MEEKRVKRETKGETSLGFALGHGHVFETAICRCWIEILQNLLIKRGLTTKEELNDLFDATMKTNLPREFERIEQRLGYKGIRLLLDENEVFSIRG